MRTYGEVLARLEKELPRRKALEAPAREFVLAVSKFRTFAKQIERMNVGEMFRHLEANELDQMIQDNINYHLHKLREKG
jgi:hypothetical protein